MQGLGSAAPLAGSEYGARDWPCQRQWAAWTLSRLRPAVRLLTAPRPRPAVRLERLRRGFRLGRHRSSISTGATPFSRSRRRAVLGHALVGGWVDRDWLTFDLLGRVGRRARELWVIGSMVVLVKPLVAVEEFQLPRPPFPELYIVDSGFECVRDVHFGPRPHARLLLRRLRFLVS